MEFRVLGPLEATHAGAAVVLTRRRCAALLAVLLSRHPDPVTAESVADAIWPTADPDRARNSVRVHATYLRKALPNGPVVLPRLAGRYALSVDPDAIDAVRFADLSTRAREAAASGAPARAASLYQAALDEWRGPPYVDFLEIDSLREEVTRLEHLRADAWEGYATALLDDDRADEACRVIEPVIDRHLTRETLVARLMLALYRTGRQPEALTLFERAKEELAEGGIPPGQPLIALSDAVIFQRRELDTAGTGTRPPRGTVHTRRRARFIGRVRELESLQGAWQAAAAGTPRLGFVAGEAGIGKTTLLHYFAGEVRKDGGEVFTGSCEPDPGDSFQPFPGLVRALLAAAPPPDSSPSLLGDLGRLAPDLLGRLPEPTEAADPATGRQRLLSAVAALLAAPARPRLVVIEDLHWAQTDALDMLRHVVRASAGQLMVLASFRDDTDDRVALATALTIGRLARPDLRIDLRAMDAHEIAAVVDAVAPVERRREWLGQLDDLVAMSAGNPLQLREMLRQLELEPNTPISDITPEPVRSLVDRRVRALDDDTSAALNAAAVLGQAFTLPLVRAVSGLDLEATLAALERGVDQGLVDEGERVDDFSFAHPLFRNAIYFGLLRSRRARIHIRCAQVLTARQVQAGTPSRWAEIARHLVTARPASDADTTARTAARAGEEAAARYAHDEAAQWYRCALASAADVPYRPEEIARLRVLLGTELEGTGAIDLARAEYTAAADIARSLGDLQLFCDAIGVATPPSSILDREFAATLAGLADEALAWLPPGDSRRVRMLQAAAFARLYWSPEELAAYAAEAITLARTSDDALVQHRAMVIQYIAGDALPIDQRLSLSTRIRNFCRDHELRAEQGVASRRRLNDLLRVGAIVEFDEELAAFAADAAPPLTPSARTGPPSSRPPGRSCDRRGARPRGWSTRPPRSDASSRSVTRPACTCCRVSRCATSRNASAKSTRGLETPRPEDPPILAGTALLALAFVESGRLDAARTLLDRVVTTDGIQLARDNFWFGGVCLFAGVAASCGSPDQRAALRTALDDNGTTFCLFGLGSAVFGTRDHWRARLAVADGDLTTAQEHLANAARICHDVDAPFWAARARRESHWLATSTAAGR